VVFSRWGKVAASATASTLILKFGVTEIIFTGVAGAIDKRLEIGDMVIGEKFYQHDMDARPLINEFEIPLLNKCFFESDNTLKNIAIQSINELLLNGSLLKILLPSSYSSRMNPPKLYLGDIASGDHFFSSKNGKENLQAKLPNVLCVEMEGAAVAQVCFEFDIPFLVIRTISDKADDTSPIEFMSFVKEIASQYSKAAIKCIV
jgi:adenosylhomocysteine nucleosidase